MFGCISDGGCWFFVDFVFVGVVGFFDCFGWVYWFCVCFVGFVCLCVVVYCV